MEHLVSVNVLGGVKVARFR